MPARPTACDELTDLLANPRFRLDHGRWGAHLRSCRRCREKLEGALVRLFASMGEHRLKWGIVAWVVGTAVAAGIAVLAR